jgi:hypothetical protein
MKFTEQQKEQIKSAVHEWHNEVMQMAWLIDRIESILTPSDEGRSEGRDEKEGILAALEFVRTYQVNTTKDWLKTFEDVVAGICKSYATIRTAQVRAEKEKEIVGLNNVVSTMYAQSVDETRKYMRLESELSAANDSITAMLAQLDAANDQIRKLKDEVRMAKHKI